MGENAPMFFLVDISDNIQMLLIFRCCCMTLLRKDLIAPYNGCTFVEVSTIRVKVCMCEGCMAWIHPSSSRRECVCLILCCKVGMLL